MALPIEVRVQYIQLRAEGKSQLAVSKELGIAKSTCQKWDKELSENIAEEKKAVMRNLAEGYGMAKEQRIRTIGETLLKINAALEDLDFSDMSPATLLDYKLKYMDALKQEYTSLLAPTTDMTDGTDKEIIAALGDVLNRIRTGDVTREQAAQESNVLASLLKAYETTEIKTKLDMLEATMEDRR